jgi:hypothetical protein
MSMPKTMRDVGMAVCAAMSLSLVMASGAAAARPVGPVYSCVPTAAGSAVLSGTEAEECKQGIARSGCPQASNSRKS